LIRRHGRTPFGGIANACSPDIRPRVSASGVRATVFVVGEAVAIISVSASALVGVGGLVAAAWGSSRERRWQTREERITELRSVLQEGGELVTKLLIAMDEARGEVAAEGQLGVQRIAGLRELEKQLALVCKRVGVRRGSLAPEWATLREAWEAIGMVLTILQEASGEGLDSEQHRAYSTAWTDALAAETAYHDATAKALGWEGSLPRWRTMLARLGPWRQR
jgi:hypothetical protein